MFGLFVCAFLFEYLYFKIRGRPVSVCSALGFRCEIMETYEEGPGPCKRSFIQVSKQGARLKMIFSLGQRPKIIVRIDSYCNLSQNKTHSYASQLILDTDTFSGVRTCSKHMALVSIQGRYFLLQRDTPKSKKAYSKITSSALWPSYGKTAVD